MGSAEGISSRTSRRAQQYTASLGKVWLALVAQHKGDGRFQALGQRRALALQRAHRTLARLLDAIDGGWCRQPAVRVGRWPPRP